MEFTVTNRVYTALAACKIDVFSKTLTCLNNYKPPKVRFPGGCLRAPNGTCLLFKSGKIVVNGVKTESDLAETVKYAQKVLNTEVTDIKLCNVNGYVRFSKKVNLIALQKQTGGLYEPELHPGLFLRFEKVSCIVYMTGAIFTGCRSEDAFSQICSKLTEVIKQ